MHPTQCAVLILPFLMALLSSAAFGARGGGMGSGGGKAIVCRGEDGSISSAQLLDLYEAEARYGWTLRGPVGDLTDEYADYVSELRRIAGDDRPFGDEDRAAFAESFERFYHFHPANEQLEDLEDVGATIAPPKGCGIEQLAIYDDELEQIDVSSDIWNALDPLNQAATIAHEELYRNYRRAGDTNSEQVRKLVGQLFSTTPPPAHGDSVPRHALYCEAGKADDGISQFYLYKDAAGEVVLHFVQLMGRETFSPIKVRLPAKVRRANSYQVAAISGGLFESFRIGVLYGRHQPYSISLIGTEGEKRRVLQQSHVTSCYQPHRPR